MKFTKSLKFKMTVWYSALLLVFCIGFVVVMNIFLTEYMTKSRPMRPWFEQNVESVERVFTESELSLVKESRLKDLDNIRILSVYSLIPFTILSFGGGYLISSWMLRPLSKLDDEMKRRGANNLGEEIVFKDNEDEVSSLIRNFNEMSKRVSKSFNAQKEFVENASHEIKTPLAIIQANIDSALEDDRISKEELINILEESKKSVTFMNRLTEDLLLFSLLDVEIEKEDINLYRLLEECRTNVNSLMHKNKFDINIKGNKDVQVYGNKVLLIRSIQNILENAIKYSGGNKIDINIKKDKEVVCISIEDNGKGISKDHRDRIFERFYRVDRSRSRKSGGSGLGLSISKEILKRHNGDICLDGDTGSRFVISLKILS